MASGGAGASASPPEPASILKLDEVVVNRIAAGEVVHRPASALKEMLENCIDAGATRVGVTVKAGGIKLLQVTDNGSGIRKEDLPIVCERFTTSKLRKFEDLESISTYGFRGEALASITHVAHVSITTMTAGSPCAYKAVYEDGKLVPAAPGEPATPKPCAGVPGTIISVEDMFYNVVTRRKALRSPSEEYQRILEVVTRYAIHYGSRGVSFSCKKQGEAGGDVHTAGGASTLDNIRAVFGHSLARELLPFSCNVGKVDTLPNGHAGPCAPQVDSKETPESEGAGAATNKSHASGSEAAGDRSADATSGDRQTGEAAFRASGYISNANFSMKRLVFILFINHRLVDCTSIKKALEAVMSAYLPKKSHPFIYLSVEMPAHHIDVNVHPTKREVNFLFEDELVDALQSKVQDVLMGANASRTFYTQAVLPGAGAPVRESTASGMKVAAAHRNVQAQRALTAGSVADPDDDDATAPSVKLRAPETRSARGSRGESESGGAGRSGSSARGPGLSSAAPKLAPNRVVRVDHTDQKLEAFMSHTPASPLPSGASSTATLSGPRSSIGSPTSGSGGALSRFAAARKRARGREDSPVPLDDDADQTAPDGDAGSDVAPLGVSQRPRVRDSSSESKRRDTSVQRGATGSSAESKPLDSPVQKGETDDESGGAGASIKAPDDAADMVDFEDESQRKKPPAAKRARRQQARTRKKRKPVMLLSVQSLLAEIAAEKHDGMSKLIKRHTFVGLVDDQLSLLQYGTKLMMVNHVLLSAELFYQTTLRLFSNLDQFELEPAPLISELALIGLEEIGFAGDHEETADGVAKLLAAKGPMMEDYFAISVTDSSDGPRLTSLPILLEGHKPEPDGLPRFLLRLAWHVDWTSERECFQTLSRELASFYAELPPLPTAEDLDAQSGSAESGSSETGGGGAGAGAGVSAEPAQTGDDLAASARDRLEKLHDAARRDSSSLYWIVEHVLFPEMKLGLTPGKSLVTTRCVVEVADTEQLYKVFERC